MLYVNRRVYDTFEFIFNPSIRGQTPWKDFKHVSDLGDDHTCIIGLTRPVAGHVLIGLFDEIRNGI